jgi:hypothetical protein
MINLFSVKPAIIRDSLPTTAITFTRKYDNKHLIRPVKFVQQSLSADIH